MHSKFQITSYNSFSENSYTKNAIAFMLRARYALFFFARNSFLNLHQKQQKSICTQNFKYLATIVSLKIATQKKSYFILQARYALFRFARNSSLNLHQKQQTSICTQNFKSLAAIVSLKIATQKTSQLLCCELATPHFVLLAPHL